MKRISSLAAVGALAVALLALLPAAGAGATPAAPHQVSGPSNLRPLLTDATVAYSTTWSYAGNTVDVYWGFDYSPTSNNLRAVGILSGSTTAIHVQAQPIRLGDRNGPLADTTANSQTGSLTAETLANIQCHPAGVYISDLYYSIRWPDGTLTTNQSTGQFEAAASAICV